MTFEENINLVLSPMTRGESTGFTPPLLRAAGHILIALTMTVAEPEVPNEEITQELSSANIHLAGSAFTSPSAEILSTHIQGLFTALQEATEIATDHFGGWTRDERQTNLISLANATVAVAAAIDREFTGHESNPGNKL